MTRIRVLYIQTKKVRCEEYTPNGMRKSLPTIRNLTFLRTRQVYFQRHLLNFYTCVIYLRFELYYYVNQELHAFPKVTNGWKIILRFVILFYYRGTLFFSFVLFYLTIPCIIRFFNGVGHIIYVTFFIRDY